MFRGLFLLSLSTLVSADVGLMEMYQSAMKPITIDQARMFLTFAKRFDDCFMPAITNFIDNIDNSTLEEAVKMHNGILDGSIPVATSRANGLDIVKQYIPSLYDALSKINDAYQAKYDGLTDASKAKLDELEKGSFAMIKQKSKEGMVEFYNGVCKSYVELPAAIHSDFASAFPESVKCLDEPLYKNMCSLTKQIADDKYTMSANVLDKMADVLQDKRFS